MGARQPVVRHRQADVVVVAVWLGVVGPADGQDVIPWQRVLGEVVMADDSPVSEGEKHWYQQQREQQQGHRLFQTSDASVEEQKAALCHIMGGII